MNGFDKGNGNSLAGKAHHRRVGALNGCGLKLSKALEHPLGMLAQLAISRDNKGVKALTATLADRRTLGQLGLFNTGQDRVWVTGSISGAVEVNDADINDGSGAQLMEATDANIPAEVDQAARPQFRAWTAPEGRPQPSQRDGRSAGVRP